MFTSINYTIHFTRKVSWPTLNERALSPIPQSAIVTTRNSYPILHHSNESPVTAITTWRRNHPQANEVDP